MTIYLLQIIMIIIIEILNNNLNKSINDLM